MSSLKSASYSRKRPFQPRKYSDDDDDDDSDIEVIPYKQQRKHNSHHANGSSVKDNLVAFLQWMKTKLVFHNFISSALKSLGYVDDSSEEFEIEEMSGEKPQVLPLHSKSRPDSPFPVQRSSSSKLHEFCSGSRDRFTTLQKRNQQRANIFHTADTECVSSKENRPLPKLLPETLINSKNNHSSQQKWLLHSPNLNGLDFKPSTTHSDHPTQFSNSQKVHNIKMSSSVKKTPQNRCLRLLDRSQIFNTRRGFLSKHKGEPVDVQFIKEVPASDVLVSRTKLSLPNGSNRYRNNHPPSTAPLSRTCGSSFTTNEVFNKQEKEMYKMLLDNYFTGGCWEPKTSVRSYRSVQTQVRDEDLSLSVKWNNISYDKYLDKYQHEASFVQESAIPKAHKTVRCPTFKPSLPEEEVLLVDDEPFTFKENLPKPLSLPSAGETQFFSQKWIEELKQSVEEETKERLRIVEEQAREIEECQRRRRQKLNLSEPVLPESVSIDKEDFPELTPEMEMVIDNALILNPPDEVLSQVNQQQVLRKDMDTLNNMNWLNDEVINFYLSLIVERSKQPGFPSVYSFSSFFYPSLKTKGYSAVKRWTRKVDIFSYDLNLVPLHLGVHWCLAVIDFRQKKIKYYDSMGGKENCLEVLMDYLINESQDKKKMEFDITGWSLETMKDIPPQMNGYDCGMFTLKYADYVTRDAPITFSQQNMQYFRRKMVFEIMTQKIC